jgi:nucleoside-diphosphate-sugar epimerase
MEMMQVLITGHRGFIGSLLANEVEAAGVDLKDGQNLLSCSLPEAYLVYHLAAQTSVEASWGDPVHDMDNLRMVARIVKKYPHAKIVYASSAAAIDPKSPYGFSKWAGAEYLKRFHKNAVICVFPNVYGRGSKSVVDLFKDKEKVTIYGDGEQIRDYVHVDDIVEGLVQARNWPAGEYFMGSGKGTSVLQLAEGKTAVFEPARKEARESILPNTTPDWKPTVQVLDYLQ